MKLNQPYYIEKRKNACHIDLDGSWEFGWEDAAREDVSTLALAYTTSIPSSIYYSLYHAGVLPDPYYGTNSKQYHWVDEKVWYYRRRFVLACPDFKGNAFLCFEGVAYYSRIWVNGTLLGDHEGMFGGPVCDVFEFLELNGENEIVVEVKAPGFGRAERYDPWNRKGENREIVPWNIARDSFTSNGDFIVMGLWNSVRLELVPTMHLCRPYLYTESLDGEAATLRFEVEIADGRVKELSPFSAATAKNANYSRAFDTGLAGGVREQYVQIGVTIFDGDGVAYEETEEVPLWDFERLGMDPDYYELQFYRRKITLKDPKLWYPNGLGEPHLYDVSVTLHCDGVLCDEHTFKLGVRTFTSDYTKGNKYRARWEKFLFSVNGREIFLKGMNWTPMDFLYDISPDRYEWCLTMAKNAGIQLIRVWSGGGMPETDSFYEICDRLGLMVWQDLFIANMRTPNYPQDILEMQASYNLYRIRNHAALVLLCGGNEFNPYSVGNAASMFVLDRTVRTLVPDRIFHYTTADKGSAHIYLDREPAWYRHRYAQLPFVGESGIHSFPNFKSIKKLISAREADGQLPDLSSAAFGESYPDLLNHFSEYIPARVPRMTARISQIVDMRNITLEALCEASHVQAYEFYQLMIQAMQENYPRCGGIMPWVFKRPWTTTAIQTVDGNDLPTLAYYAVQNAYRPINVCWCQQWSILAPREEMPLSVKVFNQNGEDLSDTTVTLTVFRPDLTVFAEYSSPYGETVDFGQITLDDSFTDTCFLVTAELKRATTLLAGSTYFNKCTSLLADAQTYKAHRSEPQENLRLDNGPWLKPSIKSAHRATLVAERLREGREGNYKFTEIRIKNTSATPAFPVTVDLADDAKRFFLNDNFFMLKGGEEKVVRITCREGAVGEIQVGLWNGSPILV